MSYFRFTLDKVSIESSSLERLKKFSEEVKTLMVKAEVEQTDGVLSDLCYKIDKAYATYLYPSGPPTSSPPEELTAEDFDKVPEKERGSCEGCFFLDDINDCASSRSPYYPSIIPDDCGKFILVLKKESEHKLDK